MLEKMTCIKCFITIALNSDTFNIILLITTQELKKIFICRVTELDFFIFCESKQSFDGVIGLERRIAERNEEVLQTELSSPAI